MLCLSGFELYCRWVPLCINFKHHCLAKQFIYLSSTLSAPYAKPTIQGAEQYI